ncbi:MAG: glycosyltransferase family 39 protein [Chthoniobacteraceae bacterium]|jgi:hypothetical protein
MKAVAACRYRFNTDETQHLHVVWGWSRGLIQYRDVFDNHPPLFYMLMAPLFRLFPERADIVVAMRLLMIPLYVTSLIAIYRIGRALYSPRAAVWLALIAGALPAFFFPGTEFRPDDLYAALWLWALVAMVEGRFTNGRAAIVGLLMGACAGITMKTSLLVSSLSIAAAVSLGLYWWLARWRPSPRQILGRLTVFIITGLLIPGLLFIYFALHHALPQLYYCVLEHNIVPYAERWNGSFLHYLYLPIGMPVILMGAVWTYKSSADPGVATRRAFIAILPAVYYLLLYSYWPDITNQDHLPAISLAPVAIMPLMLWLSGKFRVQPAGSLAFPAVFVLCLILIWRAQVIQRGSVAKYVTPIATVLGLTTPGEYVMDLKGDAIYRQRPTYYAIETYTRLRMRLGWIKNDIVQRLIQTHTAVCFHPPYPGVDVMKFVHSNYLPLASHPSILVLGQLLPPPSGGFIHFTVSIPAEYVLLQQNRPAAGMLDGHPAAGAETLAAGDYQFAPSNPGAVVLFWARAQQHGYLPDTESNNGQ